MSDEGPPSRLVELFEQALDLPEHQRIDWARGACADDPELCRQLLGLLQADADQGDPVQQVIDAGVDWIGNAGSIDVGRRLGAWRLLERIGEGGMGTVFLAERDDDEYRRRVAIKLIRGFPDEDRLERLRTERQILADLDHPNIAALLDGGSDHGQPWLAMEYIDGEPLDQWCATRGLSLLDRARLLIRVVQAVQYAHQRLVIHRDIKPGNVLVGANGEPKLLDFGIAKLVETTEPDEQETRLRYYTPRYSSPEQIEGRAISTLSDVYSLGRLIETTLKAGQDDRILPREPAAIIERATCTDPAERYSSAGALAADLQRWLDGHAVEALARRRGYRAWRFVVRHRLGVSALALALAVTAMLVSQLAAERRDARLAAARAEQTLAFLTGLIESARPEVAQGQDLTVAEVLDRGENQLASSESSPELRAGIAVTLASAWHSLDDFPRAGRLYRLAAEHSGLTGDRSGELRARAKARVVATRANQVREVEAEAIEVLAAIRNWRSANAELRADVLNDWAVWANDAGRAAEAREALLEVVRLRAELGDEAALAASEHNLALAEDRLGNAAASMELAERSLARKRRVLGPDHPSTLLGLRTAAIAARHLGDFDRSDLLLDELLAQRVRLFGADDPALAEDYNERGNAVHDAGNYARAIELYQQSLGLDARLDGSPGRHLYLNNLAAAHEDRGDFATAEPVLRESLALREQRFGRDHPRSLRARLNLARLWLRLQRPQEAQALAQEVLEGYRQSLGADHRHTRHAEWLLAWTEWHGTPLRQRSPEDLIAAVDSVLSETAANSPRGLAVRAEMARILVEAGRRAEARSLLAGVIADYRSNFGDRHPKAGELELELARIDLAEGDRAAALERLARTAPILQAALAPVAPALRQLHCLQSAADSRPAAISGTVAEPHSASMGARESGGLPCSAFTRSWQSP